jgi:NAD(P)-dependent dehydrogenase (short-subunit alcohol dehydrogenase family)
MTISLNFAEGIALVVGGSGGIGSVIASRLALAGTQVAITYYKNKSAAEDLCKEINQRGDKCFPYKLDIRDAKAVSELTEDLLAKFSNIHSVINAAGFDIPQKMIAELDQETWRKVIDSDLNGFFNLVSSTLNHLRKNVGTYIFISSAGLSRYPPGDILSVAPKAAIESLIKGIAKEEGVNNIRANSIALGVIETGIFLRLKNEDNSFFDDEWEKAVLQNLALKRFGKPEEVADLAVFLASEEASYITGQFIAVDGGYGI